MLLPSQLRLIAALLVLLIIGKGVKEYREHAQAEPTKAKARGRK